MGYMLEEMCEFLTIEGDHFDRLVAEPSQIFLGTWSERDDSDDPEGSPEPTFYEMAISSSPEAVGEVMIAYSDGYTFVGLPEDAMMVDYIGLGGRLAKWLGSAVFHYCQPDSYNACAFEIYDATGNPVRAYSAHEQSESADHLELGEPLEIEATLDDLWSPHSILKVLVHWGAPAWLEAPDYDHIFEKVHWFDAKCDRAAENADSDRLAIEKVFLERRQFSAPPDPRRLAIEDEERERFREEFLRRPGNGGLRLFTTLKKLFSWR
jgi:hypothetical protein